MSRRVAVLAALAVGGCGGAPKQSSDAQVIRGWINSMNVGKYERAASYFASGAIVEQDEVFRLPGRDQAEAFLRSLPCRADLLKVEDESKTSLASFRLRRGPGGPCNGIVKVRFTIRRGKFTEWRQLPGGGAQPGVEA